MRPSGPKNVECTDAEKDIERRVLRVGRIISESQGYKSCVNEIIVNGIPDDDPMAASWGPYQAQAAAPPNTPNPDPYAGETSSVIAQRVGLELRTFHDVRIYCDADLVVEAGFAYAAVEDKRFDTETLTIGRFFLNDRLANNAMLGELEATQAEFFSHPPSAEWHEAMHQHRWVHTTDNRKSIPAMIAECMEQISGILNPACTEVCPGDLRPVSYFDQPGCECVPDPMLVHSIYNRLRNRDAQPNERRRATADLSSYSLGRYESRLRRPVITRRTGPINVDGAATDTAWSTVEWHAVDNPVINTTGELVRTEDLSATWRATYDDTTLYFLINVMDDASIQNDPASQFHKDDSVEIYIDVDDNRATSYGTNDFQYGFRRGDNVAQYGYNSARTTLPMVRSQSNAGSYTVEVGIPWSALGTGAGGVHGLEIHVNDDDGNGRDTQLSWATSSPDAWQNPSLFTPVNLATEIGPRLGTGTLTIDGLAAEAEWIRPLQSIARTPAPAAAGAGGSWRAFWDKDNLYLFVSVVDGAAITNDSTNPWDDDSIDLYLDVDNHRGDYDFNDDQLIFRRGDPTVRFGPNSARNATGITFTTRNVSSGYTLEAQIPWSTLRITPLEGILLGLDVHINDDDNGSVRDGKRSWHSVTDESWHDTRTLGVVQLTGNPPGAIEPKVYYTATPPTIDGVGTDDAWDAWVGAEQPISKLIPGTGTVDATATWRGIWDYDNFYLYVWVAEPNPPVADSGTAWWQDDSVEVFLDPGFRHGQSYGSRDFQYILRPGMADQFLGSPAAQGTTIKSRSISGYGGYGIEVMIPWSELDVHLGVGSSVGFDVHVNDDEGGDREGKLTWALNPLAGDLSYAMPQLFGRVTLAR